MVPLHAYVETTNLIFLILAYAPGEKLFDYIKNYAKSIPNTPARELNLENVFAEPKKNKTDAKNDNDSIDVTDANVNIESNIASKFRDDDKIDSKDTKAYIPKDKLNAEVNNYGSNANVIDSTKSMDNTENKGGSTKLVEKEVDFNLKIDVLDDINENVGKSLDNMEVSELVMNSQRLLLNVDRALTDVPKICAIEEDRDMGITEDRQGEVDEKDKNEERVETSRIARVRQLLTFLCTLLPYAKENKRNQYVFLLTLL